MSRPYPHDAFPGEPLWQPSRRVHRRRIPPAYRSWLLDPGSLTRRLQDCCPGGFRVQVLSQGWGRPHLNEARRLGMRRDTFGYIREVRLLCHEQPWVYARTVIPRKSLTGRLQQLTMLGNRPLGALLFADPSMHRDELEICRIGRNSRLYRGLLPRTGASRDGIWGRRSVFYLDEKPLLVSEIFLPNIIQSVT